jgi:hypothetical protein
MMIYPGPGLFTLEPRPENVRHCLLCGVALPTIARNSKYCPAGECRERAVAKWAANEKARKRRVRERQC